MDRFDMEEYYRRNPEIIATEMDDDLVMMDVESGHYFNIRGSGARIWELTKAPVTETAIVRTLCAECDVDEATCRADVQKFLTELREAGLILVG